METMKVRSTASDLSQRQAFECHMWKSHLPKDAFLFVIVHVEGGYDDTYLRDRSANFFAMAASDQIVRLPCKPFSGSQVECPGKITLRLQQIHAPSICLFAELSQKKTNRVADVDAVGLQPTRVSAYAFLQGHAASWDKRP